jgi:hypothetical protein
MEKIKLLLPRCARYAWGLDHITSMSRKKLRKKNNLAAYGERTDFIFTLNPKKVENTDFEQLWKV